MEVPMVLPVPYKKFGSVASYAGLELDAHPEEQNAMAWKTYLLTMLKRNGIEVQECEEVVLVIEIPKDGEIARFEIELFEEHLLLKPRNTGARVWLDSNEFKIGQLLKA